MRITLLIIYCLTLSGCAGISIVSSATEDKSAALSTSKGMFKAQIRKNGMLIDNISGYTQEKVISLWGYPSHTYKKDNKEYWVYSRDTAWRGVVIYAIIPVPLLLPTGDNATTIVFENGQSIGATYEHTNVSFTGCGIFLPFIHDTSLCDHLPN